jgi:hypothetical protein
MRRHNTILWTLMAAAIVVLVGSIWAARAECAFCSPYECYNSAMCGGGCLCLKRGMDLTGSCVSVDLSAARKED